MQTGVCEKIYGKDTPHECSNLLERDHMNKLLKTQEFHSLSRLASTALLEQGMFPCARRRTNAD